MLTYLVEDDSLKAERVTAFIEARAPDLCVEVYGSFQSGLRAVEKIAPVLMILDMTIPTFDRGIAKRDGRFRPLGGYEIMRKMRLRGLAPSVIILTQLETFGEGEEQVSFAEISARCKHEFPEMFVGSVYFSQDNSAWQAQIEDLVSIARRKGGHGGKDIDRRG